MFYGGGVIMNMLSKFVVNFCKIVEKHCKYVVVSGFLVISAGRSRATEDIDIIIPKLSIQEFEALNNDLYRNFVLFHLDGMSIERVYGYLSDLNVRYVYRNQVVPNMKLRFAKNEVDEDNLENRQKISITDLDIFFPPIECAIVYKEYCLGYDKDIEDAFHLRNVFADEIDDDEIKRYQEIIRRVCK